MVIDVQEGQYNKLMKDANAAITLLEKRPEKIQALNDLNFFQVIFPVVLRLHSHLSFFHYLIATLGHILPSNLRQSHQQI